MEGEGGKSAHSGSTTWWQLGPALRTAWLGLYSGATKEGSNVLLRHLTGCSLLRVRRLEHAKPGHFCHGAYVADCIHEGQRGYRTYDDQQCSSGAHVMKQLTFVRSSCDIWLSTHSWKHFTDSANQGPNAAISHSSFTSAPASLPAGSAAQNLKMHQVPFPVSAFTTPLGSARLLCNSVSLSGELEQWFTADRAAQHCHLE